MCEVSPWGDQDPDVLAALNRARASVGLPPRSPALARWRAEQPGGAYAGVARVDGEVRAGVVGVRRRVWVEGEPVWWMEVVDAFNDFGAGAGLRRTDAYVRACEAFARELGGAAPGGVPILHGVPTRRAHRIGLARLRYEILRSENVLSMDVDAYDPKAAPGVDVEELDELPEGVDAAFERFRADRGAILARDAETLDWRYARHPERRYRLAVARRGGEIRGYTVLRRGRYAGWEGGLLVDWIVPPSEPEVGWALLAWAAEAARADGAERLVCNVADKFPEWILLQAVGMRAFGTDEYLVFRSFQKPYVMSWLFASWYYTLGDSERG